MEKFCKTCNKTLPINFFAKGHNNYLCVNCYRELTKEYRNKNKDVINEQRRNRYKKIRIK